MQFEIFETSDQDGALTGVMLISNGKVVNLFPSVALAVAYAKYEFNIAIQRAIRTPRKSAKLVFEAQENRMVELNDGAERYCIVIDPEGNVVPRNFSQAEAMDFIEAKLAIKFGRKR
jgi:hypothetical protein